jgi:hypothetical protein
MSLLRLLTNPKVMGEDLLTPEQAIGVYRELLRDECASFADEPGDAEALWLRMMTVPSANGSVWTDGWPAALGMSQQLRVVSFDAGLRRWPEL